MVTFSLAAVINSPEDLHAAMGTATNFALRGVIASALLSPATMMGGASLGLYEPNLAPNAEGKCPVCSKQL
ncbi:uncharacterized protein JCM10292_004685, partial [Rhodotorula paludigena]|uniref:uncharacterized protein n=1 Tax=Rhodotorula paludigena TaxID=86838 RepID=UPI00316F33FB